MSPIATSTFPLSQISTGAEITNDPTPLVGPNSVFVLTRLKDSLCISGQTRYRVREFSKNNLVLLNSFILDLSNAVGINGRGRVASALYHNGNYYLALPTTVSNFGLNENGEFSAIADIAVVKMDTNWTFNSATDVFIASAETNDRECYVSGFDTDGDNFYLSYLQINSNGMSGILKSYDSNFNLRQKITVKTLASTQANSGIRPSIEVFGNKIFYGESDTSKNAEIHIYEMASTSVEDESSSIPKDFVLYQNYPNPFGTATLSGISTTTIRFSIMHREWLALKVFDCFGRKIRTLFDGVYDAGEHSVIFDAKDLTSNIYFYQITTPTCSQSKSMLILK